MFRYFAIVLLALVGQNLCAQSNEPCTATSLPVNSSCTYISGTLDGATTSSSMTNCLSSGDPNVFYTFTATDASMTVEADGSAGIDLVLEVHSGSCTSLTNIECEDGSGSGGTETANLTGLTVGNTYTVVLYDYFGDNDASATFDICVTGASGTGSGGGGTTGSACANAQSLTTGVQACASTTAAGLSTSHPCSGFGSYDDGGYWFEFTGDGNNMTLDLSGYTATAAGYYIGMEVLSGSCASLSCEDDVTGTTSVNATNASLTIPTTTGQQYYVFISVWGTQANFCLDLSSSGSSGGGGGTGTGENCANAVPLTIGVSDCATAVDNGNGSFGNSSSSDNPCSQYYNDDEYWYEVTGTGNALNINMSSLGSDYQALSVLDACAGSSPTCIADYQNGSSSSDFSITTPVLTAGNTYYIVVSTWASVSGTPDFCINTSEVIATTPGGTDCANLGPICTDDGLLFTALTGIPNAEVTNPGNDYDCLSQAKNPTWYYLEIGVPGAIDMTLSAAQDVDFALWGPFPDLATASANCNSYGTPVDCSYDPSNTENVNIANAQVGEVYVLLITNYAGVVQDISLEQTGGAGATDCSVVCGVDAGTVTATMANTNSNDHVLCYNESMTINSVGFTLPTAVDLAGMGYAIYTAAPTTIDPNTDPNWTGYYFTQAAMTLTNDANNTYDFIINNPSVDAGANGVPTNRELVIVPITMDDAAILAGGGADDNLGHDLNADGCFSLGTPVTVSYLEEIVETTTENCGVDVIINIAGGYPQFDPFSSYTVSNNGPGTMVQSGTRGEVLTFTNLSAGDVISVDVTNDNNGCTKTITFTTTCSTSTCDADAGNW